MPVMMGPLSDMWNWLKTYDFLGFFLGVKKHRLSFITIHCMFLLSDTNMSECEG